MEHGDLVGGLVAMNFEFSHILGMLIPIDGPYFSEGWLKHQPVLSPGKMESLPQKKYSDV